MNKAERHEKPRLSMLAALFSTHYCSTLSLWGKEKLCVVHEVPFCAIAATGGFPLVFREEKHSASPSGTAINCVHGDRVQVMKDRLLGRKGRLGRFPVWKERLAQTFFSESDFPMFYTLCDKNRPQNNRIFGILGSPFPANSYCKFL
ncbi:MAG: hypothetical protein LUD84_07885 [Clostridiales bacterium]|nr:hypothetical protein [Clostridiales bacterium]